MLGSHAWTAILPDGKTVTRSSAIFKTTNNKMELLAVISALMELEIGPPIMIRADSKYVLDGMKYWVQRLGGERLADQRRRGRQEPGRVGVVADVEEAAQPALRTRQGSLGRLMNEYVDIRPRTDAMAQAWDLHAAGHLDPAIAYGHAPLTVVNET